MSSYQEYQVDATQMLKAIETGEDIVIRSGGDTVVISVNYDDIEYLKQFHDSDEEYEYRRS